MKKKYSKHTMSKYIKLIPIIFIIILGTLFICLTNSKIQDLNKNIINLKIENNKLENENKTLLNFINNNVPDKAMR